VLTRVTRVRRSDFEPVGTCEAKGGRLKVGAVDHFQLIAQNGTVVVHALFIANVSAFSEQNVVFTPTDVVGDPLDFATLELNYDPL
jgi:hypothetical protein